MSVFSNFRYKLLSLVIAAFIWFIAQGQNDTERSIEIPLVLKGLPEHLVATEVSADSLHMRIRGSRSALRNLETNAPEYVLEAASVRAGEAEFRIDLASFERRLPRGTTILQYSPANVDARFEPRHQRRVRVRPVLSGDPAVGHQIREITTEPAVVQIEGARSEVLRLTEVVTETVDVSGLDASLIREVGITSGVDNVWVLDAGPVELTVAVEEIPPEEEPAPDPS